MLEKLEETPHDEELVFQSLCEEYPVLKDNEKFDITTVRDKWKSLKKAYNRQSQQNAAIKVLIQVSLY